MATVAETAKFLGVSKSTLPESTVRHYVAGRRRVLQPVAQGAFADLVFDAGELAQVDWGTVQIDLAGQRHTAQVFWMRLAYSGAEFVQAFPHQRMEVSFCRIVGPCAVTGIDADCRLLVWPREGTKACLSVRSALSILLQTNIPPKVTPVLGSPYQ